MAGKLVIRSFGHPPKLCLEDTGRQRGSHVRQAMEGLRALAHMCRSRAGQIIANAVTFPDAFYRAFRLLLRIVRPSGDAVGQSQPPGWSREIPGSGAGQRGMVETLTFLSELHRALADRQSDAIRDESTDDHAHVNAGMIARCEPSVVTSRFLMALSTLPSQTGAVLAAVRHAVLLHSRTGGRHRNAAGTSPISGSWIPILFSGTVAAWTCGPGLSLQAAAGTSRGGRRARAPGGRRPPGTVANI
jgi:hypothetical protein